MKIKGICRGLSAIFRCFASSINYPYINLLITPARGLAAIFRCFATAINYIYINLLIGLFRSRGVGAIKEWGANLRPEKQKIRHEIDFLLKDEPVPTGVAMSDLFTGTNNIP
jgi:hypothetical protein